MKDQMIPLAGKTPAIILDCIPLPRLSLAEGAQGTKALCSALTDILWFSDYVFPGTPYHSNPVKMTVTAVNTSKGHCSEECKFTVEIIHDPSYSKKEILSTIRKHTYCKFTIRENTSEMAIAAEDARSPFILSEVKPHQPSSVQDPRLINAE